MAEFMFPNVAYRATVYRTGLLPLQFSNVILIFRSLLSRRTAISHEKGKRFFEYYCGSTYKVVEKNSM